MKKQLLIGSLVAPAGITGGGRDDGCSIEACVVTAVEAVTAYMRPDGEVFATLDAGMSVEAVTRTLDGWYGFDPGIAQAPNQGLDRLRWVATGLGTSVCGWTATAPTCRLSMAVWCRRPWWLQPRITRFVVTPTGTLNDYVAGLVGRRHGHRALLEVHLPGDPSGEPMLVLDELPLSGDTLVTVPFHTPDSGVRFVLWGVNRVPNPPSPQQRYEYVVSQTLIEPPFATPTATVSPVSPPATVPGTQPPFTPSPTYTPPPAGDLFNLPATYQRYDNGFMIWRSDIGFIWAFTDDGRVFGFELADYNTLPQPNAGRDPDARGESAAHLRLRPGVGQLTRRCVMRSAGGYRQKSASCWDWASTLAAICNCCGCPTRTGSNCCRTTPGAMRTALRRPRCHPRRHLW